ncbi:MAG: zinc-dependent metalloprotease [Bacteroidia bacterium]
MRKVIMMGLCLLMGHVLAYAQRSLYRETDLAEVGPLSNAEEKALQNFRNNPEVAEITVVKVDFSAFKSSRFSLSYHQTATVATEELREMHDASPDDFSWFGKLSDETGVFFTVIGRQLASKFYMGNVPMLIVPLRRDYHLLVAYKNSIDQGVCGLEKMELGTPIKGPGKFSTERIEMVDDACLMRVLWIVTAQAEPEISMALELAARMLQDETNLAYLNSQINYRMEMARVERTSYVETTANTTATAYGVTSSYPSDLINLSTGAGLLSAVPTLRNLYQADIVVMVRSQATNTAQGFYGIAYGVPVDPNVLNAGNAFCIISTQYMIGGRFTFAHEMGHVQGARHDNHAAAPTYARGYVFSTAANNNRTIMAVGGSCNPPTGCRVQYFSNPNVTYGGIPVGVAGQYENYRRINETGQQVRNFRMTDSNLLLPNETYANEILARHLATSTISTNNSTVVAQNGSRVSMRAGASVTLMPGFSAEAGSVFTAYISDCVTPTTSKEAEVTGDAAEGPMQVAVSPNPTTGRISVRIVQGLPTRPCTVQAMDMMGRVVTVKVMDSGTCELDLSVHPAGAYFVVVDSPDGQRQTVKVLRQ